MIKKLYPLLLCILVPVTIMSSPVSLTVARKVASVFLSSQISHTGYNIDSQKNVDVIERNGQQLIYVFHLEPTGFILVSADDASYPVPAYSFESAYRPDQQPDNFINWMDSYLNQIHHAIVNVISPDDKTSNAWLDLLNNNNSGKSTFSTLSVTPLMTTSWDQGQPYNYLCPSDPMGPGGHVWAGCVATAMAQVANYWRWPLQGSGSHGYLSDYGYLFADYGSTAYKWEEMTNIAIGNNFQMAQLQSHFGIAVDMMYSPNGSGAYSEDAASALINYFGMTPDLHLEYAPNPVNESWKTTIRSELDAGRPMYYHGFGPGGGHAFNLDGYQGTDYFHFNWGWGGSFNGYYYLENLNPGGSTFNDGQGAIIGIEPTGNYPYYCNSTDTLTMYHGTIEDGSGPAHPYLGNTNCGWLIAPEDSITKIKLTFHRFDLTDGEDYLTIYGGSDTTGMLIGSYTGSTIPPAITYPGGSMFIKFTSNSGNNGGGWFASFDATRAVYCSGITTLNDRYGNIHDGSGLYDYHENSLCRFRILPDSATSITLTFNEFDTYDEYDFLKVIDLTTGDLIDTFYGSTNPGIRTYPTGKLLLMFHSNHENNASGWNIDYFSSFNTGKDEDPGLPVMHIYPNPASERLLVNMNFVTKQEYLLQLLTIQGAPMASLTGSGKGLCKETIELGNLSNGIYILRLESGKGVINRRIVVQH